ncbi:ras family-domain-containing protein [Kockiozyma suomiensis]|uniref:ras family-domain-containing protein n=1 Tax=Kockiozyma suomiensis TaxID=1337062 RepID=UPI003344221F
MALSPRKENSGVKLAVLGDAGVGKTALAIRLCLNHFIERYDPTIEDSYHKHFIIAHQSCTLEILDTAGLEEYSAGLREQWIRDAEGFVLVYSVTSRASFQKIAPMLAAVERQKGEQVPAIIVATKSDKVGERQVPSIEGSHLSKKLKCEFFESSARNDINITRAFTEAVKITRASRLAKAERIGHIPPRDLSKLIGGAAPDNGSSGVLSGGKKIAAFKSNGKPKKKEDCVLM